MHGDAHTLSIGRASNPVKGYHESIQYRCSVSTGNTYHCLIGISDELSGSSCRKDIQARLIDRVPNILKRGRGEHLGLPKSFDRIRFPYRQILFSLCAWNLEIKPSS